MSSWDDYNLPESDVKVEYDKERKMLHISNLPSSHETPAVIQGHDTETGTEEVWIMWGRTSVAGEHELG